MLIILEVVLLVALIGIGTAAWLRRSRATERGSVSERRVDAYMQTIRRQAPSAELAAMTDAELRDVLLSGARNLRVQSERRWYILLGGVVVTFIAAIVIASDNGIQGFALTAGIGAVVLYGINTYLERRMRAPLEAQGLDAERLRVE